MPGDSWSDAHERGYFGTFAGGEDGLAGHDGTAYTVAAVGQVPTERPVLSALEPDTFEIGSPDVTLHCHGSGFDRSCRIGLAGFAERTDYVSDQELTTVINGEVWSVPADLQVVVLSERGSSREMLPFAVVAPTRRGRT